jgi:hypothetical protein
MRVFMFARPVRERVWSRGERPRRGGLNIQNKKWTRFACPFFVLRVGHLFDFDGTFAGLAFCQSFRSDALLPLLGVADDQFHELGMIGRVIQQREIRRARLVRRVKNTAVRVDL